MTVRRIPHNRLARFAALSLVGRWVRADILHATLLLPPWPGRPTVVTIHDISFERHPEFFPRRWLLRDRGLIRDTARRASRVITVSETSRRDLIELWHVPADRVVVIYNGVDEIFAPGPDRPDDGALDPLRVLAVGVLEPRKNLGRLLEALAIVGGERRVELRVVGPDGYQAKEIRRAPRRPRGGEGARLHRPAGTCGRIPTCSRVGVPIALRRIWAAGCRGHGQRHPGGDDLWGVPCRRSRATRR